MLIRHDLGLVAETCGRVAVFCLGRIVEEGAASDIFARPRRPNEAFAGPRAPAGGIDTADLDEILMQPVFGRV